MQIISFFSCILFSINLIAHGPTIILNPAGDAKVTGRRIYDSFERSYTLQIAQGIKQQLEIIMPHATVLLTRIPGEIAEPLQYATFANRINATLYLSIHCFEDTAVKPRAYLYQCSYAEPITPQINKYALYRYDQAHLIQLTRTSAYAVRYALEIQTGTPLFDLQGLYVLPFAPLMGIACPALGIELGLSDETTWQTYCAPLATGIARLLEYYHE